MQEFTGTSVFNRGSSENFIGVNPNNDPNNTIEDKINYLMDNFFPSPSSEDNLDYTPIIGHVEPMVLVERGVPAQVSSSSSDRGSKLRGPSQNSPRVASERDVNIT
ncbi:hypothetical protein AVEN_200166-1 [Araneus ventricosus]|uniref:Uncharacterized protein n=1 Tax=Araneus ventricosus TaxID=182803 RepID=A0A4Y2RSX7_ARAVE|nr:hypothetical protein AVEN_156443-1 [Araneus ventricosus]GBN78848.1 hypothetical protein AVEN_200166-1 [Araneus ventricosus]